MYVCMYVCMKDVLVFLVEFMPYQLLRVTEC